MRCYHHCGPICGQNLLTPKSEGISPEYFRIGTSDSVTASSAYASANARVLSIKELVLSSMSQQIQKTAKSFEDKSSTRQHSQRILFISSNGTKNSSHHRFVAIFPCVPVSHNLKFETGANSGVGYAATNILLRASEPFHVIMASRSLDKAQAAMSEIQTWGNLKGTLSTIQLELTNQASILAAAKSVEETHGHLDALVNNAAVGSMDPDIKTRMQISMDTNVIGPTMVEEAFRPLLLKAKNPYSVYVSSGMGSVTKAGDTSLDHYKPIPGEEAYRSSKAALNMLAILEAKTYGPRGLKVFGMCPGFVVSNLRGKDEGMRTGKAFGAEAGDPEDSGRTLLRILTGERDDDVGKFVHKDGVYPW